MKPVVAIVGRPNVGKSTLFNALARRNVAIIHDMPGVTRDRNYIDIPWEGGAFVLVDTGGFATDEEDAFHEQVRHQTRLAIEEADLVLLVMDGTEGLQHGDEELYRMLARTGKPVACVVNKTESQAVQDGLADFYRLGAADDIVTVAAKHRIGLNDLMLRITGMIPRSGVQVDRDRDEIVVSIIGRPNVGKSSLVNRLVGQERSLVSPGAGTTRDPVDTCLAYNGRIIRLIDTAGIRRKSRVGYTVERYCVFQAFRSVGQSEVALLLIDALQGVTAQDAKLAAQICERGRACVIVVNKWDLIEKDSRTHQEYVRSVREALPFLEYAPVCIVSAETGQRVRGVLDVVCRIHGHWADRIPTAELNRALETITARKPPPRTGRGRTNRLYYMAQVETAPPLFRISAGNAAAVPDTYARYVEHCLRERFGFEGIPLRLRFVDKT